MSIKLKRCFIFFILIHSTFSLANLDEHESSLTRHPEQNQQHAEHPQHVHEEGDHSEQVQHSSILLSKEQKLLAEVEVAPINANFYEQIYTAPAEVKANGYTSYIVSPRTESVVVSRYVVLGEKVETGQKLVTLFSQEMARAQADYLLAKNDWQRTARLGPETVSERERLAAKTRFNAAYGQLVALGLSDAAIQKLTSPASDTLGQYTLVAKQAGVVLKDSFSQGQRISAGSELMLLADEKTLWVEAKLSVNTTLNLEQVTRAFVSLESRDYAAQIIQQTHTIDTQTRTKVVRLSVANEGDTLHAGMFVDVSFVVSSQHKEMLVPESAVIKDVDLNWVVFVEQPDKSFLPLPVQLGTQINQLRIINGLPEGSRIAVKGAFFIASEFAKSGFDPHNH
ncbi:efflux RND transporter periplasmic adaptor subunit [Pseudoalteromonas sp. SMS1]|uniref:efflux RND transporter periplasmic adaptor subunit n=1 Tax=Pseudoalteromonas sp. SMS1 TaxID=2908894 RepID=UPI001F42F2A4|nr:efflux RND transporter periplasmic adaptor subunit [Pseudoalteromonas sp. SMS1]MCF2856190.1 efflux RND transporter periplasmic adaptor subunit [Pseudoalteromonas sp. SMS1]